VGEIFHPSSCSHEHWLIVFLCHIFFKLGSLMIIIVMYANKKFWQAKYCINMHKNDINFIRENIYAHMCEFWPALSRMTLSSKVE